MSIKRAGAPEVAPSAGVQREKHCAFVVVSGGKQLGAGRQEEKLRAKLGGINYLNSLIFLVSGRRRAHRPVVVLVVVVVVLVGRRAGSFGRSSSGSSPEERHSRHSRHSRQTNRSICCSVQRRIFIVYRLAKS